jgi:L-fucose isomerase-like protein
MDISLISLRSALSPERARQLDASSKRFLDELNDGTFRFLDNEEGGLRLFFIESGGSEAPFLKVYPNYQGPYYLLTTGNSNSLASALEILSFLQAHNLKGEILYGEVGAIRKEILLLSRLQQARSYLAKSRLGVIGEPSDWLINSSVDFAKARAKFGVEFIKIPYSELKEEVAKHSYPVAALPGDLALKAKNKEVLEGALDIYGALRRLVDKYRLSGFTIRCFDLLGDFKNTSCLALALLNSEGISAGCEGDEASLLSMHLFRSLGLPAFQCNPSVVDLEHNRLLLAHCTLPLSMAPNYSFLTHFESDLGIGIRGKMSLGDVTIFKLANDLEHYHLWNGKILENLERPNLCRTQIQVQLASPLQPLLSQPYGNHLMLAYGDERALLERLLED